MPSLRRELWKACLTAAACVLAVALCITTGSLSVMATRWVDDLGQLLFAGTACLGAARTAWRLQGAQRRAWTCFALAPGSWFAGQAVWCYYELLAGRQTPFPSPSDLGYLAFPVAICAGLVVLPTGAAKGLWRRHLLDGMTISCGLLLVSWVTALGAVVSAGADTAVDLAVSVAYPASDVVVVTMILLLLAQLGERRGPLMFLLAGLLLMACGDSAFAYLQATGSYHTGDVVDLGWYGAFALVALAARLARRPVAPAARAAAAAPRWATTLLPYAPLVLGAGVAFVRRAEGVAFDRTEGVLALLLVTLVLVRQYVVLHDNRLLIGTVERSEEQLRHQAFHDTLTGLANRALFVDRLDHALDLHRRDCRPLAVLICDVDDFKAVNDTLGHAAGDQLLVRVADRLRGALRPGDTLARLGGDEFAVVIEDHDDAYGIGDRLLAAISTPISLPDSEWPVTASIGVAIVDPDQQTPSRDELLGRADTAMYSAKRGGKNQLSVFRDGMLMTNQQDAIREDLTRAVAEEQVLLHYQPVFDVRDGSVKGYEGLARWRRDGVDVPPLTFIPLAERIGLLPRLTRSLLDQACRTVAQLRQSGSARTTVAVNVSPALLADPALVRDVAEMLARHGIPGRALVLEITEVGQLLDVPAALAACRELGRLGVGLSLDDFGTGYSSLATLIQLPFTQVKVDRLFTQDLHLPARVTFLRHVLTLAEDLKLQAIVEGVESPEQAALLRDAGCWLMQGYLFGRPVPASELPARVVPAASAAR